MFTVNEQMHAAVDAYTGKILGAVTLQWIMKRQNTIVATQATMILVLTLLGCGASNASKRLAPLLKPASLPTLALQERPAVLAAIADSLASGAPAPPFVGDACHDALVRKSGERVFSVNVLVDGVSYSSAGVNCIVKSSHLRSGIQATVLASFNDAWLYGPSSTARVVFRTSTGTRIVPTSHFSLVVPMLRQGNYTAITIPFRYQRYAIVLATGAGARNISAIAARIAGQDRLSLITDIRHVFRVRITLPTFAVRGVSRVCKTRCVTTKLFISINESGAGNARSFPVKIPKFSPAANLHVPPQTLTFNHPFYFAIIDFNAHAVLIAGHVDHPAPNA